MGAYFFLSGNFRGRAIESLMFEWVGYHHLERILRNAKKHGDFGQFATRLRDLFRRAEQPRIAAKCQCGNVAAEYIAVKFGRDGVAFFGYHCDSCKNKIYPDASAVRLVFSSVDCFSCSTDKGLFLREMREACGLSGRITAEEAYAVFYPPTQTLRPAGPPTVPAAPAVHSIPPTIAPKPSIVQPAQLSLSI